MKTAIFLGAGASKADGAPLQCELMEEFKHYSDDYSGLTSRLSKYVLDITSTTNPPSFEEILGFLTLSNKTGKVGKELSELTNGLVAAIAQTIDKSLRKEGNTYHDLLIKNLADHSLLDSTTFITTNYDILIDNAITRHFYSKEISSDEKVIPDYGIITPPLYNYQELIKSQIKLFKPHGSLNWLYCDKCNTCFLTPLEKGAMEAFKNNNTICPKTNCPKPLKPILIPPSFIRPMTKENKIPLEVNRCLLSSLKSIDHIVFCGYSFSDADIRIKALIKESQVKCNNKMRFTLVNNYEGKINAQITNEIKRYTRFLGNKVTDSNKSFEEFCIDPLAVIEEGINVSATV